MSVPTPSSTARAMTSSAVARSCSPMPTDSNRVMSSSEVRPSPGPDDDVPEFGADVVFGDGAIGDGQQDGPGFGHHGRVAVDDDPRPLHACGVDLAVVGPWRRTDGVDVLAGPQPRAEHDGLTCRGQGAHDVGSSYHRLGGVGRFDGDAQAFGSASKRLERRLASRPDDDLLDVPDGGDGAGVLDRQIACAHQSERRGRSDGRGDRWPRRWPPRCGSR